MEELHRTALAYFKNGSEATKQDAREFYWNLYSACNRHIGADEFIAFFGKVDPSHPWSKWFSQLCTINEHEKSEALSFEQVLTLFYTIRSGRPSCDGCGFHITAVYFTCLECDFNSPNSFDVCLDCYHAGNYQHRHAREHLLDNFALLKAYKLIADGDNSSRGDDEHKKWKRKVLKTIGIGAVNIATGGTCSIM